MFTYATSREHLELLVSQENKALKDRKEMMGMSDHWGHRDREESL